MKGTLFDWFLFFIRLKTLTLVREAYTYKIKPTLLLQA